MGKLESERKKDFWKSTAIFSLALNILFIIILFTIRAVDRKIDRIELVEGNIITINADTDVLVIGRYLNGNLAVRVNGREINK